MTLHLANLPHETLERARWLEQMLVGPDLNDFIAELEALNAEPRSESTLEEVWGNHLPQVIEKGIVGIPDEVISLALRTPARLLDLQEQILLAGSSHWDALLSVPPGFDELLDQVRTQVGSSGSTSIEERIAASYNCLLVPPRDSGELLELSQKLKRLDLSLEGRRILAKLNLTPDLLARVLRELGGHDSSAGWGWKKVHDVPPNLSRRGYLERLADLAEEWFQQPRMNRTDLASGLVEFFGGYAKLVHSSHPQLSEADRAWLIGRCQEWAKDMAEMRRALRTGKPVADVRRDADAIVSKLLADLRERANVA